ncbi:amino acid ABC transporter permease [Nocardioides speluncae]|uniref:amino acid ABC transporter permease n=1 Tax=Nocardioides speluncae TaxID=2670337 RepID=UPI000D6866CD|nr:amino acid ABC transporter permease [Nocardioides speluncae]
MSAGVLFDAPGPATAARHRIYTIVSLIAVAGMVGYVIWRLYDTEQLTYEKWEPFLTPKYVRALLVEGLLKTLQMAATAVVLAVAVGGLLGVGKLSDHGWVRWPCWAFVEFFRAVPVLLLMIFSWFLIGIEWSGASYWGVVTALALYNGAVLAEVFRAGVLAVPKGQSEAAYAVGMRKSQVMNIVLLPQAVKIMLPAILSQCVVVLKDTALGYAILAPGLTEVGKRIFREFGNHVPTMIVIAFLYIIVNLILTWIATWVQKKFVGEKKVLEVSMTAGLDTGRAV